MTTAHAKHDDYMTPKSAWESIAHLLPKEKILWEPFYGDGKSGEILRELGFKVIHQKEDFFQHDKGEVIVSNPPFSKTREILGRLKELGKPFVILLPTGKLTTHYMADLFGNSADRLQIIIPARRIHFIKHVDGKPVPNWKNETSFDCFWYCWKMGLPRDILWLH